MSNHANSYTEGLERGGGYNKGKQKGWPETDGLFFNKGITKRGESVILKCI